jgi:phosphoribosylformylglycinamidine synthase PurS subunit
MKVTVKVTLKSGVLDPQGQAVARTLHRLGHDGVADVRIGKLIELDVAAGTTRVQVEDMCKKILANTVIEEFKIEGV